MHDQATAAGVPIGAVRRFDDLAPADYVDPVIEAYKRDVDRSLLRENLKLTVQQRFEKFESFMRYLIELRGVASSTPPTD